MYALLKVGLTALIVVAISEIAKRSTVFGALVASLPLASVLAMVWLYHETKDAGRVATLSSEIFWLVLPSLVLFVSLPMLIRRGVSFYPALVAASVCTAIGYLLMTLTLRRFGLKV
jgi:hypothetical protein